MQTREGLVAWMREVATEAPSLDPAVRRVTALHVLSELENEVVTLSRCGGATPRLVAHESLRIARIRYAGRSVVGEMLEAAERINETKGRGYAGDEDILRNFYSVATRTGATVWQVWATYVLKHVDWLRTFFETGVAHGDEGAVSRLTDIYVYAALGAAIAEREAAGRTLETRNGGDNVSV